MDEKICIVFVCNLPYYNSFRNTYFNLLNEGNYKGEIVLVIGDDLYNSEYNAILIRDPEVFENKNIKKKYFPNFKFDESFYINHIHLERPYTWIKKLFQYHKLHLFDVFFKQWNYIFYVDCGVKFLSDITPILNEKRPNILFANRDGMDNESAAWCLPETPGEGLKIGDQFDKTNKIYNALSELYRMNEPYFKRQ
jgi:hypothetical protein